MKTLILTGFDGAQYESFAGHTVPLMQAYADRHGNDFSVVRLTGERPASWMKVPAMLVALEKYDRVVWIDIDVVIVSPCQDIVAVMEPRSWQALVEHFTECGQVPNCGVWVVAKPMQAVLGQAWEQGADYVLHPWWEQAAIMRQMGYAVEPGPRGRLDEPTALHERTTFLSPEWNHHPADENKPKAPNFVHVTQYPDRLGTIRDLAACAAICNKRGVPYG